MPAAATAREEEGAKGESGYLLGSRFSICTTRDERETATWIPSFSLSLHPFLSFFAQTCMHAGTHTPAHACFSEGRRKSNWVGLGLGTRLLRRRRKEEREKKGRKLLPLL